MDILLYRQKHFSFFLLYRSLLISYRISSYAHWTWSIIIEAEIYDDVVVGRKASVSVFLR